MANLNSHPLVRAAYEACLAVEKLPASVDQTAAISAVSALLDPIEALALERDALRADLARARAVLDTALECGDRTGSGRRELLVVDAAWQAWREGHK